MKKPAAGALGVLLSTSALLLGTVSTAPAWASVRSASTTGRTLVIDNSFVLVTADPGHEYEPTGNLVDYALYDSLLTFKGGNLKSVVPDLATSYQVMDGARKYIFHLNPKARFSDGTPVTSADVVWSLNRMINLKGNPAFMLAGENITADGPETVVMTSSAPTRASRTSSPTRPAASSTKRSWPPTGAQTRPTRRPRTRPKTGWTPTPPAQGRTFSSRSAPFRRSS
ncbi:MAG TPA: ABC transporter substrate-binding protein [Acidimicrobiales bacterium]|nr:ABC transporter substrate-binding protein [Acidimicrobiales bacterium]